MLSVEKSSKIFKKVRNSVDKQKILVYILIIKRLENQNIESSNNLNREGNRSAKRCGGTENA